MLSISGWEIGKSFIIQRILQSENPKIGASHSCFTFPERVTNQSDILEAVSESANPEK
jgi:hypothetical protein